MMIERNIKTVIVTGPTGAVGTALCSRLLQAGVPWWRSAAPAARGP